MPTTITSDPSGATAYITEGTWTAKVDSRRTPFTTILDTVSPNIGVARSTVCFYVVWADGTESQRRRWASSMHFVKPAPRAVEDPLPAVAKGTAGSQTHPITVSRDTNAAQYPVARPVRQEAALKDAAERKRLERELEAIKAEGEEAKAERDTLVGLVKKLSQVKAKAEKDAEVQPPPSPVAVRWAVVIGISNYKHPTQRLPSLRFADRDASAFAEFLKSDAGGGFAADHVRLLTNEQATATEVRAALFEFLRHTVKEDMVVIYFSGHGIPDPDKPSNLYLVAHDSNPARIAATGVPMWDIETALVRTIAAERVLVLVDACHSAGAAEGVRGIGVSGQFKTYFDELARTKPGRLVFTSCEGYEVSREAEKWGGGHGVFTWALLEGLRGKADLDKDGFVRLGEVLDYVDITVRRETANEQHPARAGTQFDRSLPMGVVK
jgi:hypothetical protein